MAQLRVWRVKPDIHFWENWLWAENQEGLKKRIKTIFSYIYRRPFLHQKTTQMMEDMRLISVVGSVHFSPHIKTTKDRRQYVHFTIATNPYEETPRPQFHIKVYDQEMMIMAMKLTKGTKICVTGEYKDSIAIVAGCFLISQQIIATSIELVTVKINKQNE